MDTDGARKLVVAIIESAILEIKDMQRVGYLDGINITTKADVETQKNLKIQKKIDELKKLKEFRKAKNLLESIKKQKITRQSLAALVEFFKPNGPMDKWISVAALDIDPDLIRQNIGFKI